MQPFYWICTPPADKGGLIWTVRLCDIADRRVVTKPDFTPKPKELESLVLPKIKPACGALFFTTSSERAMGCVIDSGSCAYVATKKKYLMVTCDHVWEGFLKEREKNSDVMLCACFDDKNPLRICVSTDGIETKPIDRNRELDIATFDMEPFLEYCGADKNFFIPNYGPESRIKENDWIGIIGHPGRRRIETENSIGFGREPCFARVTSISGFKIRLDFTRVMNLNRELLVKKYDENEKPTTSGFSGGPAFLISSIYEPFLTGFVTDHIQYADIPNNYIQLTTSRCINEDGTIKPASSFY